MKRRRLLKHLSANGCQLRRHGRKHDIFLNPETGRKAPIPRPSASAAVQ
ncbi:MAG: type II toxin-antitoxin system HicA family toxin [Acidobacteria bacterium]|nr:type II toxin-antitoxin system HicA family toxin [Acidobacteriota bacterium]